MPDPTNVGKKRTLSEYWREAYQGAPEAARTFLSSFFFCLGLHATSWLRGRGWFGAFLAEVMNHAFGFKKDSPEAIKPQDLKEQPEQTVKEKVLSQLADGKALLARVQAITAYSAKAEIRFSRVLLPGLGGAGKTQFVGSMLRYTGDHPDRPRPGVKTLDTRTYVMNHQCTFQALKKETEGANQVCAIELTDYRGQDVDGYKVWVKQQQVAAQPPPVHGVVFLVDLFESESARSRRAGYFDQFDQQHIDKTIIWWKSRVVSWLEINGAGHARPSFCCLYANKLDLLTAARTNWDTAERKALDAYRELGDVIEAAASGEVRFIMRAGSVKDGTHLPELIGEFKIAGERLTT